MASYNELLALIDAYINRNGVQAITGQILNGVLKAMVDQLGRGYTLMGYAEPTGDPGTPDGPESWFASVPGTYTNYGEIQVAAGELALLSFAPSEGWTKNTIYEGFREVTADIDGNVGTPEVGVSYANGVLSFDFRNMKGNPGEDGDPAGFGAVTASVDDQVGTPSVSVSSSGPDTAKNFAFAFHNLKGETGVTSVLATVDNTSGNPQCSVSLQGGQLTLAFTGLKGAQGNTGSSVDYPFTIVNNLTTNDPAQALSAAMGVQLESEVSQLEAKVTDLLPLCTKRTGYYVNASSVTPGSSNFDYYTYKIDGEKKIRVYTKLQYSNNLPAYLLYSTDTITADGYITHTNWKSGDGVYEISIPDNCKLVVVNVYRPNLAEPTIGMDGEVYSQLLSTINKKIATTDGNVSAIDGRVEFLENLPVDGVQIGTVIQGKYIAIDGTPQNSSSGSRYYEIQNAGYKKVYARNGNDTNTVAALAFYNGTPDSSSLISSVPFSYAETERTVDVPENTLFICVGVNGRFAGNEVIRLIPDIAKMNEDIDGLKNDVEEIRDIIGGISGGGVLPGDGSAAEVKELINPTRPYYFAQGWADSDNFGYLDERLKLVPEGKHFLVYTDIHLDYYGNFGLSQKQSIIMKYVQKRLRDCNVVFLGDFIGSQSTELAAQKEMAWFAADNYSKFGDRFLPVLGDHDTDRVGGGLPQGSQLTEEYIYETYFKPAHIYGAVQDKAIPVIDTIVFSDDAEINAVKRTAWKNYMKMHYYKDDEVNKIRFISLQATGANFRSTPNNYNTPRIQLPFICWAISTAPDDYDIVIVAHEYQLSSEGASTVSVWEREMYKALTAFRNRSSYTITAPYSGDSEEQLVWPYVKGEYPSTFDYSAKTGKVAVLQGDAHLDGVCYYDASENESNPVGYGYVQGTNDVIRIIFDRSTLVDNNGFPTGSFQDPMIVLRCYRRAVAQRGDVVLLGTTDEVLFDVVTINEDGITLTRFGDQPVAGKVGLFPIFSEEESYEVGDMVVYYETIGSAYFPKAYTFISAHTPGAFNANEVEEYIVTVPYVRNYTI